MNENDKDENIKISLGQIFLGLDFLWHFFPRLYFFLNGRILLTERDKNCQGRHFVGR